MGWIKAKKFIDSPESRRDVVAPMERAGEVGDAIDKGLKALNAAVAIVVVCAAFMVVASAYNSYVFLKVHHWYTHKA